MQSTCCATPSGSAPRVAWEPFEVDGERIGVSATVGVAVGTPELSGGDLLARGKAAMRAGKSSGGVVQVGPRASGGRAAAQLRLLAALRGAVDRGEIVRIGELMLHSACTQLARWREHDPRLSISVNVAPLQLPNLPVEWRCSSTESPLVR